MLEAWYQKYKDDGLIVIHLMAEDSYGGTPNQSDLTSWANSYGLNFPVVSDPSWGVSNRYERDNAIPSKTLIGPGAKIIAVDEYIRESDIKGALP